MDDRDREVGGLRCGEVLERLSAYVDGELDDGAVRLVDAHLRGCDRCERFGGRFAHVVAALRKELAGAEELSREVETRLKERLQAV